MYLKRLELQGYKTFASKTEFDFQTGITAIVGPNGSGKSNITDAIRWVLGEQRPTNLRIKRTDDMIFAGSRQRARQGMAEVCLTLDNSAHWLPLDFAEVAITRRVYRSGDSEYLLNGSRMRVRDIADLLAKGGLSRDAYIVIGQGLVDAALSLQPTQRRALFEAAAGIDVYQSQKEDALAKLEETADNLTRVRDILREIAPRLGRLERQAERAQEHELLTDDLDEILRIWYGFQWQRNQRQVEQIDLRMAQLTEFVALRQAELDHLDAKLAALGEERAALRRKLSAWHEESSQLHAESEAQARQLAVAQERQRGLTARQQELSQEAELLAPQIDAQAETVQAAQQKLTSLMDEREQHQRTLDRVHDQYAAAKQQRDQLANRLEQSRRQVFRHSSDMATLADRADGLTERQVGLDNEETNLVEQRHQREQSLARRQAAADEIAAKQEALRAQINAATAQIDDLLAAQQGRKQRLEEIDIQRRDAENDLVSLQSRQRMLQSMRREMTGYYSGVRAVVQAADEGQLAGIHGPVVRLIHIAPELDAAMDVALGSHLQDIVVDTWQDAEAAISLLKRARRGRATFLPLDTINARSDPQIPTGPGILGLASDLIDFDPQYEAVVRMMLNRTLVVEDLDTAHALLPRNRSGLRIVTLEGDLVLPSGSVSGGSRKETDSKLAFEREWQALPQQIRVATAKRDAIVDQRDAMVAALTDLAAQVKAVNDKHATLSRQLAALEKEMDALERQQDRLRGEMTLYERSLERIRAERDGLSVKIAQLAEQSEQSQTQHAKAQGTVEQLEAELDAFPLDALQSELNAAQTALAVAERHCSNQQELLAQQQQSLQRLRRDHQTRQTRADQAAQSLQALDSEVEALSATLAAQRERIDQLRQKIEPAEAQLAQLEAQQQQLESNQDQTRSRYRELETQQHEVALERRVATEALERLEERISEELGPVVLPNEYSHQLRLDLSNDAIRLVPVDVLPAGLEDEIKALRARIRRLGVINPDAPSEYAREQERHDFLTAQVRDLEEASHSLRQVIAELDQVMEARFAASFDKIATAFAANFSQLFGGGTAQLALTDPDDISNTGVEIVARPPGKRLQNLSLLSGGERALTAVALLFAMLKVNPLPFCVLDEVDAMLDEANVSRFRDMLVEMSTQTQFIIVTHNRHTVNAAHNVYGISMQQNGISTVLSLALDEAEEIIKEQN